MPVTNYNTYNGRIRSETTAGVITSYLTDALGSVTATVNQSQVVQNTYRYKPYGATLAKSGTSHDPGFLWTGDTGSLPTGLAQSGQYNQARHYNDASANWTTVDPLWPEQAAFAYAWGAPSSWTDANGHFPHGPVTCVGWLGKLWKGSIGTFCMRCRSYQPPCDRGCCDQCNDLVGQYMECWRKHHIHSQPLQPVPPTIISDPGANLGGSLSNCVNMAKDWNRRLEPSGKATTAWAGECQMCCGAVLGRFSGMPGGLETIEDCLSGCFDGEFLSKGPKEVREAGEDYFIDRMKDLGLERYCPGGSEGLPPFNFP